MFTTALRPRLFKRVSGTLEVPLESLPHPYMYIESANKVMHLFFAAMLRTATRKRTLCSCTTREDKGESHGSESRCGQAKRPPRKAPD